MAQKVFALGFFAGTPTAVKCVPLAGGNNILLIGLCTEAQTLYTPAAPLGNQCVRFLRR
jgi:hypothetical protein